LRRLLVSRLVEREGIRPAPLSQLNTTSPLPLSVLDRWIEKAYPRGLAQALIASRTFSLDSYSPSGGKMSSDQAREDSIEVIGNR
jgi:hypothetical protein